jgi:hypothetical protein
MELSGGITGCAGVTITLEGFKSLNRLSRKSKKDGF